MGLLDLFRNKIREIQKRSRNKKAFKEELFAAIADGQLSDVELGYLADMQQRLELSDADVKSMRVAAYQAAYVVAKQDGAVTQEEETELRRIQMYFGIEDKAIAATKAELARLRLLTEIQLGNLPLFSQPGIILQKAESAHWIEPASLIEERVVGRHYVGASSGMSFRIAKGVTYRVGSSRGRLITEKADVPVASGELVLTNKRVVFRGDKKSFNYKLDKILDIRLYDDGAVITDSNGKPRTLNFPNARNVEIVGAVLTQTLNQHING